MSRKGLNIYKRKDGRWEARYIKSRTAQGKPLYGYLYASSYHEARNRLQDVIRLQGNAPNSKEMSKGSVFEFFSISSPKSSSANRTIPVSHMLFEYLNMYPLGKTGYFLSGSSSRLIEPRCVQRRFHKILMACGLENRNFHVLRHTFATRCVEARIDIKTLSEILGHSSVTITMNRYVHPSLELKRETMEQLADFISVK